MIHNLPVRGHYNRVPDIEEELATIPHVTPPPPLMQKMYEKGVSIHPSQKVIFPRTRMMQFIHQIHNLVTAATTTEFLYPLSFGHA